MDWAEKHLEGIMGLVLVYVHEPTPGEQLQAGCMTVLGSQLHVRNSQGVRVTSGKEMACILMEEQIKRLRGI